MSADGRWRFDPGVAPWVVSGLGMVSFLCYVAWSAWVVPRAGYTPLVTETVTVGIPALGLIWGGHRLARSNIRAERYGRLVQWCIGGATGFLAMNVFVMVFFPADSLAANLSWAHFAANTGAIAGFAVGYVEARAIQREVEAAAAAVRAERLEEEREVLSYLNDLLRHEVLNSAQIIGGHASLVVDEVDEEHRPHLEKIDRQSEVLTTVIEDVRAMLNSNREMTSVVDLTDLLTDELSALQRQFDDVEVDAAIPESVRVEGNEGIKWIFANLFENAVVHNPRDRPRVDVTVETTPETVTVHVADNGPGIPKETRETLFERKSENHGLGLYLVRILTHRYGGDIELSETGPNGSVFTVTLPRATSADDPVDERGASESIPPERSSRIDVESDANDPAVGLS